MEHRPSGLVAAKTKHALQAERTALQFLIGGISGSS
jgi:hypothetical protein